MFPTSFTDELFKVAGVTGVLGNIGRRAAELKEHHNRRGVLVGKAARRKRRREWGVERANKKMKKRDEDIDDGVGRRKATNDQYRTAKGRSTATRPGWKFPVSPGTLPGIKADRHTPWREANRLKRMTPSKRTLDHSKREAGAWGKLDRVKERVGLKRPAPTSSPSPRIGHKPPLPAPPPTKPPARRLKLLGKRRTTLFDPAASSKAKSKWGKLKRRPELKNMRAGNRVDDSKSRRSRWMDTPPKHVTPKSVWAEARWEKKNSAWNRRLKAADQVQDRVKDLPFVGPTAGRVARSHYRKVRASRPPFPE
jgi:hypothetical protein